MRKENRQATLLKLIADNRITRQDELAARLETEGYPVTQSSVSRDLVELGIAKINGAYSLPVRTATGSQFGLKSLESAGENLIVAKCGAGLASACAVRIDSGNVDEIVGTVAGDDTIFIAVRDGKAQKAALRKIWEIFETNG